MLRAVCRRLQKYLFNICNGVRLRCARGQQPISRDTELVGVHWMFGVQAKCWLTTSNGLYLFSDWLIRGEVIVWQLLAGGWWSRGSGFRSLLRRSQSWWQGWDDGGGMTGLRGRGEGRGLSLTGRFYERSCTDLNLFHAKKYHLKTFSNSPLNFT